MSIHSDKSVLNTERIARLVGKHLETFGCVVYISWMAYNPHLPTLFSLVFVPPLHLLQSSFEFATE